MALVGCGATPSAPASPHARAMQRPGDDCVDVHADIERRAPGAESMSLSADVDGDGVSDQAFRGFCSMMGGNCDVYVYVSHHGCPRFAGQVMVTRVASAPHCAEPPHGDVPCKLSASRMMIHGEIYEYLYDFVDGAYREAGVGHKGPPPPAL